MDIVLYYKHINKKRKQVALMKNIIFDVDGTLWDTTEVVAKAWNRAISDIGGTGAVISAEVLKKEFGKTMDVIASDLFFDASEKDKNLILQKCCEYEHDDLIKNTEDLMYPNVQIALGKLSEKCNLFIVSNCQCGYIELFMKKSGIEKYITDFECFGNTGRSKGENIKLLMERNNLEDVVYVGDTQGDYEATVLAGVPFVYAEYGFGSVENFYLAINDIKELLDMC
jgi:phosphoglycolate phosphatase